MSANMQDPSKSEFVLINQAPNSDEQIYDWISNLQKRAEEGFTYFSIKSSLMNIFP